MGCVHFQEIFHEGCDLIVVCGWIQGLFIGLMEAEGW